MLFQYLFLLVTLAAAKELVTSNLCELKSLFFSKKKVVDIDLVNVEADVDQPSLLDRSATTDYNESGHWLFIVFFWSFLVMIEC